MLQSRVGGSGGPPALTADRCGGSRTPSTAVDVGPSTAGAEAQPGVPLWCTYEEDSFASPTQERWFEAPPGRVLWRMNREPLAYDAFAADGLQGGAQRWGRTRAVAAALSSSAALIPVRVVAGPVERRASMNDELQAKNLIESGKRHIEAEAWDQLREVNARLLDLLPQSEQRAEEFRHFTGII